MGRIAILLPLLLGALPVVAQEAEAPAEPETGPTIERTSSGIIVIRGRTSRAPQAESGPESAAEAPAGPSSPAEGEEPGDSGEAEPETTVSVQRRSTYDISGKRVESSGTSARTTSDGSEELIQRLLNSSGREITYLDQNTEVVSQSASGQVTETVAQRYDPDGRPVRQQLRRTDEKKLPDGTILQTITVYEENINGRMDPVSRTVVREKTVGGRKTTTRTVERPSMNGGFRTQLREESVTTTKADGSAETDLTRHVNDGGGRMIEAGREKTVMTKSGSQSTTETTVWEKTPLTGDMEIAHRRVGRLEERPDGSKSETVEFYGHSADTGAARNVNATRLGLVKSVEREFPLGASGEVVETTETKTRSVADPSRMSRPSMTQRVSRITPDGETIETSTYEQGVSGRLVPTEVTVEERVN